MCESPRSMIFAVRAGFVYALIVFAVGFIIGTIRTLLIVPRVGAIAAVALEMPVMLTVSWLACLWTVKRFKVPHELTPRIEMSLVAFATLMFLELDLSVLLFRRSVAEHFATYGTAPGGIGLAGQIVFAVFPISAKWWSK